MSVLIRGMEMPKEKIVLSITPDGEVQRYDRMFGHTFGEKFEAVPVSPHGDLVDANDLLHDKQGQKLFRGDFRIAFNQIIERAPTIISAEPAEEGKR